MDREQRFEATKINHEIMTAYAMSGVGPGVEWKDRYAFIEPLFKKLLAELDQSAYRTSHVRGTMEARIRRLETEKHNQDYLTWVTGDNFDINTWLNGT